MILRNALLNLAGLGLPMLVALACIPPLVMLLGTPRFGLLTLLWAVVSTLGVFDLGVGRALTQQLSAAVGAGRADRIGAIASGGLMVLSALGALTGVLLWAIAPYGAGWIAGPGEHDEAVGALRALAWAMPSVLLTSGLRGVLESKGAFVAINGVRLATGVATFAAPWAVVSLGWNDLVIVSWALVAVRAVGCAMYLRSVAVRVPNASPFHRPDGALLAQLLRVGGWMTVTNVVSPLMTYLDRFVVGAVLTLSAVAWYATPQEIVSRLLIVSGALSSVLFPRLSELYATLADRAGARHLERLALHGLFLALFPVMLGLGVMAGPVLERWVGPEFASHGAAPMLAFCLGVLINSLAQVPFASIQARGRAHAAAMLHLVELPLFVLAVWLCTLYWGVTGAAIAWTARMAIDYAALRLIAEADGPGARSGDPLGVLVTALALGAFAVAATVDGPLRLPACLLIGLFAWCLELGRLYRLQPRLAARGEGGLPMH